jgi:hypothetical protein
MPELLSDESVVSAADQIVSCELGGGAALLNLETGTYFGLNAVAAHVWSQLGAPVTVRELLASITSTFDVDEERARADLTKLATALSDAKLAHVSRPADR